MILVMKLLEYWGSSTNVTNQSKTSSIVQLYTEIKMFNPSLHMQFLDCDIIFYF